MSRATIPDDAWAALRSKILQSSQHPRPRTLRVELGAFAGPPLAGLRHHSAPLGLWWDDASGEGMLGVGACRSVIIDGPTSLAAIETRILAALAEAPPETAGLLGGCRFLPQRPARQAWQAFGAARFVLPALFVEVRGGRAFLGAHHDGAGPVGPLLELLDTWRAADKAKAPGPRPRRAGLSLHAPDETTRYLDSVRQTCARIAAGALEKAVIARVARAAVGADWDFVQALSIMRTTHRGAFAYALCPGGPGASVFFGVTPELLYARDGDRLRLDALAGTAPVPADGARVDRVAARLLADPKEQREHAFVVSTLKEVLKREGARLAPLPAPRVRITGPVQHLYTPVRAQGARAGLWLSVLHPTPAVAGTPTAAATAWIDRVEPFDRGLYCGPIGWVAPGRERFAVALRGALFDRTAGVLTAYAGAGIVAGSVPERELRETEAKLRAVGDALAAPQEAA